MFNLYAVLKSLRLSTPAQQQASRKNLEIARSRRWQGYIGRAKESGTTAQLVDEDVEIATDSGKQVHASYFKVKVPAQSSWGGEEPYDGSWKPDDLEEHVEGAIRAGGDFEDIHVKKWTHNKRDGSIEVEATAYRPVRRFRR